MKNIWQRFRARLWEIAGSVNIRTKILGIVLGGTILLSLTLIIQVRYSLTRVLEDEFRLQGVSIGRDLAARSTDLILINDHYALRQLLMETKANNQAVRYAFVVDPKQKILAHTFGEGFPEGLIELNQVAGDDYQNTISIETSEGLVWDIAVPIFNGQAGTTRVGISSQGLEGILLDITSQVLLATTIVLALSLLAATFLTFILTRPILDLVNAARAIGRGDFSQRVRRYASDEIGELADAFNQMVVTLEKADEVRRDRENLRSQLLKGVITAQEEERGRIARELHDSTSQGLTSLMVGLRGLDATCDNPQVHNHAQELRQIAGQMLDDVHSLAVQLRPPVLDDLGLQAALERLANEWGIHHHILVDVLVHLGSERLPGAIEIALYRMLQEALTNVSRHAQASSVSILVERRQQAIVAVVEDDGQGFDAEQIHRDGRLGLIGIRERADILGGRVMIESAQGRGTSLFIWIPLAEKVNVTTQRAEVVE